MKAADIGGAASHMEVLVRTEEGPCLIRPAGSERSFGRVHMPQEKRAQPLDHWSDTQLLQRVAAGDREAFFVLYRRYVNLVYSMALRVLGDTALAEEVTQDVFLKIWQKGAMYDPSRGRFSSWLLSVTRFAAIDRLRHEGRRPRVAENDETQGPRQEEVRQAQVDHTQWQQGQELRLLLAQLPPEQREVIELAFFGGLTHRELAAHLNLPLGTVKSRLRLGLAKLRAMWFGEEEQ